MLRIQRKRTKGWRMPDNTISVCRPSIWGNPYKVSAPHPVHGWEMSAQESVDLYKNAFFKYTHKYGALEDYYRHTPTIGDVKTGLKGKNLACWCRVGAPCHGDFLLEVANSL